MKTAEGSVLKGLNHDFYLNRESIPDIDCGVLHRMTYSIRLLDDIITVLLEASMLNIRIHAYSIH